MDTIESTLHVRPNGTVVVGLLPKLAPGRYRAIINIDKGDTSDQHVTPKPPLELRMLNMAGWPIDAQFRREEL